MDNALHAFYTNPTPDHEDLIAYLGTIIRDQPASQLYYFPPATSRLWRECQDAIRVLKKLEADEDSQDFLQQPPVHDAGLFERPFFLGLVSEALSSTKTPHPPMPERFTIGSRLVSLRQFPTYWYNDANVLLAIYHRVGDGIRSDGSVRLDLALRYYAIEPHAPQNAVQWDRLRNNLLERQALTLLGFEGHVSDINHLLDTQDDQTILTVVQQVQIEHRTSLFAHVLPVAFTVDQENMARTTPAVLLSRLLSTPENLALARKITAALDWYGGQASENCSQSMLVKVLARALWLTIPPEIDPLYPNELSLTAPIGASYSSIRRSMVKDFEVRLSVSPHAARLAMCVTQANIASEVWLVDIPDELRYGVGSAWIGFKTGFILAEAVAPGSARHMTFEQLLNLAAEHCRAHANSPKQQALVAAAKLIPTLQWARHLHLLPASYTGYSAAEIDRAVTALERYEAQTLEAVQGITLNPPSRFIFDSDAAHKEAFHRYLEVPRGAYATLIKTLLIQLSPIVGGLDRYEVKVYSLRTPLRKIQVEHETRELADSVRGRAGFILGLTRKGIAGNKIVHYAEMFPRIGLVRVRDDIKSLPVGGVVEVKNTGSTSRPSKGSFRSGTPLPFDWKAYCEAKQPDAEQSAILIAEQLGHTLIARPVIDALDTLESPRYPELANMIARELFFIDEQALLEKVCKATRALDLPRDLLEELLFWGKMIVPFWGSVEDLASGDLRRIEAGGLGLFTDIISFAVPIGKYSAGLVRVANIGGKFGLRVAMPKLKTMTLKLIGSTLQELNPLSAVQSVLLLGRFTLVKLGNVARRQLLRRVALLRDGTVAARHLISADPLSWSPRQPGDTLFTVDGYPNIPMRNIGTPDAPDYRLIDPDANRVFGPRFREPVTVISNSSPLMRPYTVPPHWINGLKADAHGIFYRADYNQKFICNIDDRGKIAVYQVRDNSYGFYQETAAGAGNSFSVVLVNPKTNRDLSINLSSVKPGHWYSSQIKILGGGLDKLNAVTPSVLLKWTEASESALNKTMADFARTHNLDPDAFRQFVHTSKNLTNRGTLMLDRAGVARTAITNDHLVTWRSASQNIRNKLTLEGFAADHNLDPGALAEHVNLDGSYRAAGKVLARHASGEEFTPLTCDHLQEWHTLYNAKNSSSSIATFVDDKNLNPVVWRTYVKDNGSMTPKGREMWIFGERNPVDQPVARKRPASPPEPGPSKRPRQDNITLPSRRPSTSIVASYDHRINNNAPILQDPQDVRRSMSLELEGRIDTIKITDANHFFDEFTGLQHIEVKEVATKSIREWIASEGNHHRRLDRLLEVRKLTEGPERGWSVVAKIDIKRFDVLGPYTGKLHLNQASMNAEIAEKSETAVATYLFQTNTKDAVISGHGNSNTLSLINAVNVPNIADAGIENVGSMYVGKYMAFIVAWRDIPAGTELLMDYGQNYWKYMKP